MVEQLVKKIKPNLTVLMYFVLLLTYFELSAQQSQATVVVCSKYASFGMFGSGGALTIMNQSTLSTYSSIVKNGFHSFIVIENVPLGRYKVLSFEFITGYSTIIVRDTTLFNHIEISETKVYFIGNYFSKKIPPVFKLNIELKYYNRLDLKGLNRFLKSRVEFTTSDILRDQKLFKNETIQINLSN
jgi:hypothetical protein